MDQAITNKSYRVPNQMFFDIIESELKTGKSVKFNVAGNSMLPFLKDSDQVVIKQPNLSDVKIGDILLVKYEGKFILHRLVKISNGEYYLAGDGNLDQIERVSEADVLALVVKGFRGKRELKVNNKLNKRLGLVWYYIRPLRYLINKF
jgi:SOS-response transcriptional repressor LexA